ncbi:MAG: helix-turn-helix domain-containing protein [Lachnospiraceae bacterium]|nr:helix-turn-helix domain-containing protein [Lachnospiraceae bacterium]
MRITGYESNHTILIEVGQRIKDIRIAMNYTQTEMSERSGVALSTISRIERGESVNVENILNVLRVLSALENLELILPEQTVKPTDMADKKPKRQRVSRKRKEEFSSQWVWGEDKT